MCPHTQPLNADLLFLFNPLNLRETPALFKKNSLHFFNFFWYSRTLVRVALLLQVVAVVGTEERRQ
jgi:hypothetical protein